MNHSLSVILALVAACFCTAMAVVYTTHLSRQMHAEINRNQQSIRLLGVEESRLLIEESTFSNYGLVEERASEQLGMTYPEIEYSRMIALQ